MVVFAVATAARSAAVADSAAFPELRFSRDWVPGQLDRKGRFMTGTETNYIVAHEGRLYAAVGVWNSDPTKGPNPGPSVLVKKSANAPWEVDAYFGVRNVRVAVLASLTVTTDAEGAPLAEPVRLLMAGASGFENAGEITVFVRDDAAEEWVKSVVAPGRYASASPEVRLLSAHRDRVTGVDRVIVAVSTGEVYSGAYDPSAPGRIRWNSKPELDGRVARIMSSGEANGDAYLTVDITESQPGNGGLFRRVDGPQPSWEWIGEWGRRTNSTGVAWMRGLTAVPDPESAGKELLLGSREVDGVIEIINPQRNHEHAVEFDFKDHFATLLGLPAGRLTTIFAYNGMTPAVHPETGEKVLLIGGGVEPRPTGSDAAAKAAWYLVRHSNGRYDTGRIYDPDVIPASPFGLRATRTICASPFREEAGRVFYFGGFDAGGGPHRYTAWIYRGSLPSSAAAATEIETTTDVRYATISGVNPNLLSLDLYAPKGAQKAPVVLYVHGGSWNAGDKRVVAHLPEFFAGAGWVLGSVNYRLAPQAQHPAMVQDVAAAVAWVHDNIALYGGDPEQIYLIGHSAGAHLAALLGTDTRRLADLGQQQSILRAVVPFDTAALDVRPLAAADPRPTSPYRMAFGNDPATWADASPIVHVAPGKGIPPFMLVAANGPGYASKKRGIDDFARALREAGTRAEVVDASSFREHQSLMTEFGAPGDPVSRQVLEFLDGIRTGRPTAGLGGETVLSLGDVQMGSSTVAYLDPEFLQEGALAVFADQAGGIWAAEIDKHTGLFRNNDGKQFRIDGGLSQWSRYSNGPEWGLDAAGPAVFYLKDNEQGAGQLWRAEPPWDQPRRAQLTTDKEIHNWIAGAAVNSLAPSTRVIVYRGRPGASGNVNAWIDEDRPDEPTPFATPMVVARWAYNSGLITLASRALPGQTESSQVQVVDTYAGTTRTITADAGNKIDPWLWQAPEFDYEWLLAVNVDGRALGIYRDTHRDGRPWERIATIALPADAPHPALKSVEPVNGGRGAFGKSYFTVQAGGDADPDTSVWLFGFDPAGQHLVRRLDDGPITGRAARRLDPESLIGERELFVYYTLAGSGPAQLRLCRTGIFDESATQP
jgi:acetyl esterase/lipase